MWVIMDWACGTHENVRHILQNLLRETTMEGFGLETECKVMDWSELAHDIV
jgi:hypothetical protein